MRARGQSATTRRVTFSVPGAPSDEPDTGTPTFSSASLPSRQGLELTSSHSTRTGLRFTSSPWRNGSGNAPTMAGTRMAVSQRR
jgi:hypothetical protein